MRNRCSHRSDGKVRMVKKCRTKLKALWERSHQELRNEPPHDIAHPLPQNPFLASFWIGSGLGWPERDFGIVGELCHVGARFKDPDAPIFMAPSAFFTSPDCPLEQCALWYLSNNWNKKCFATENFWKVSQQMLKCFFFPLPTYRMVEVSAEIALFWARKMGQQSQSLSSGNKTSAKSFGFPNDIHIIPEGNVGT